MASCDISPHPVLPHIGGRTMVAACMSTSTAHALPPLTARFALQSSTSSFALSYALGVARARYLDVMAVPMTRR